jgi:selenocysteine lyase/cysteine desulfurase
VIYFDNAATTLQKPPAVARAASFAFRNMASPGGAAINRTLLAAKTAFACREAAAELFRVSNPEHVVLTFNATHALNIAIKSTVRRVTPCSYRAMSIMR